MYAAPPTKTATIPHNTKNVYIKFFLPQQQSIVPLTNLTLRIRSGVADFLILAFVTVLLFICTIFRTPLIIILLLIQEYYFVHKTLSYLACLLLLPGSLISRAGHRSSVFLFERSFDTVSSSPNLQSDHSKVYLSAHMATIRQISGGGGPAISFRAIIRHPIFRGSQ